MVVVKKTMKYIVLLGLISFMLIKVFSTDNGIFTEVNMGNGIIQYRLNLNNYLQNLQLVSTQQDIDITTIMPTRTWQEPGNNWLDNQFWDALINNMALVFDYLYMPINLLAYPIRVVFWALRLVLALLGWNMNQTGAYYDSTLIQVLSWITRELKIPYL